MNWILHVFSGSLATTSKKIVFKESELSPKCSNSTLECGQSIGSDTFRVTGYAIKEALCRTTNIYSSQGSIENLLEPSQILLIRSGKELTDDQQVPVHPVHTGQKGKGLLCPPVPVRADQNRIFALIRSHDPKSECHRHSGSVLISAKVLGASASASASASATTTTDSRQFTCRLGAPLSSVLSMPQVQVRGESTVLSQYAPTVVLAGRRAPLHSTFIGDLVLFPRNACIQQSFRPVYTHDGPSHADIAFAMALHVTVIVSVCAAPTPTPAFEASPSPAHVPASAPTASAPAPVQPAVLGGNSADRDQADVRRVSKIPSSEVNRRRALTMRFCGMGHHRIGIGIGIGKGKGMVDKTDKHSRSNALQGALRSLQTFATATTTAAPTTRDESDENDCTSDYDYDYNYNFFGGSTASREEAQSQFSSPSSSPIKVGAA